MLAAWLTRSATFAFTVALSVVVPVSAALAETAVVTDVSARAAVIIQLSITFLNFI